MKSLKIYFIPEKPLILPYAKFEILQGIFYKLLSYNKELSEKVHNMEQSNGRQFKMFCFTDIEGQYTVSGKFLIYSGELKWEIRSFEDSVIDAIVSSLTQSKEFYINSFRCSVIDLNENVSRALRGENYEIRTSTPIAVYETSSDGYRTYYTPDEDKFYTAVENNLKMKYLALYDKESSGRVIFAKKQGSKTRKCVAFYAGFPVNAYYGDFILNAPPEICDIAYYCGLGAKNSQGFGTIKKTVGGN